MAQIKGLFCKKERIQRRCKGWTLYVFCKNQFKKTKLSAVLYRKNSVSESKSAIWIGIKIPTKPYNYVKKQIKNGMKIQKKSRKTPRFRLIFLLKRIITGVFLRELFARKKGWEACLIRIVSGNFRLISIDKNVKNMSKNSTLKRNYFSRNDKL